MDTDFFNNLLQILELYKLKQIPKNSSNHYKDEKDNVFYKRRETTAEHIYSCLRLADFFIMTEMEFKDLDRLKVYELLIYHDDVEIITRDTGISEEKQREKKETEEIKAVQILHKKLPRGLDQKLLSLDSEFRAINTEESKFAHGIDKMDSLVHEFQYPEDWGPKGFDEINVRKWFQPTFEYSPTFMTYFEATIEYLIVNGYFKK